VGSYVEFYMIDRQHAQREAMLGRWKQYLRIAWKIEPMANTTYVGS
jgi:hypothetical protein